DPLSLVGAWTVESLVIGGKSRPLPPEGMGFEFAADGSMVVRVGTDKPQSATYKTDSSKPAADIDLTAGGGAKRPPSLGIFKFDGDILTICFDQEPGADRARSFESPPGSIVLLMTLKRAKKE